MLMTQQKELLRRQGVLLSTLRGKEKEAAEEVVEALTPVSSHGVFSPDCLLIYSQIVRRLYPGLLENYADRAGE